MYTFIHQFFTGGIVTVFQRSANRGSSELQFGLEGMKDSGMEEAEEEDKDLKEGRKSEPTVSHHSEWVSSSISEGQTQAHALTGQSDYVASFLSFLLIVITTTTSITITTTSITTIIIPTIIIIRVEEAWF